MQRTAAAVGAAALLGCRAARTGDAAPGVPERLGVQLYTLRDRMAEDVDATLAAVAAVGYDEVEFAGYFGHAPAAVRALLDAHGLAAPAVHVPLATLRTDLDGALEAAETIGHQYLVCPWLAEEDRQTADQYRALADLLGEAGERCRAAGRQLAYHNHDFEFVPVDGVVPYDLLLERTDADLVQMELDLYWAAKAGVDPFAYFERWPGRFPLFHLKDMAAGSEGEIVPVGEGVVPFDRVFAEAGRTGQRHVFVEHDHPSDPLASIRASYRHLQAMRG